MAISKAEYLKRLQETYPDRHHLWDIEMAAAEQRGEFGAPAEPTPSAALEGGDAGE